MTDEQRKKALEMMQALPALVRKAMRNTNMLAGMIHGLTLGNDATAVDFEALFLLDRASELARDSTMAVAQTIKGIEAFIE